MQNTGSIYRMPRLTTAYIGLGSNLGNKEDYIKNALNKLAEADQIESVRISDFIQTAPLGGENQPDYINAVAEIKTALSAQDLHSRLIEIETSLGRRQEGKWSPRTIDLDILLFGQNVINLPSLTIPHPQMHLRSFVLKGLCQLAPDLLHPVIKEPMHQLVDRLGGADFMFNPDLPQLVSIAGVIGVGKTTLTEKLSNLLACDSLFEPYDTNPFLPDVYAGKKELSLDSQLYFLTSRIAQLNHSTLAPGRIVISDYIFDQDIIYAGRLLDAQQLSLYKQVHQHLAAEVSAPVLVIYLTDSAQSCLQRIHRRNRPYEQQIKLKFLQELSSDYQQLFANWKTCPIVRILISEFDCMKEENIVHLADQIKSYVAV